MSVETLKTEFANLEFIKVFEVEVTDKRTGEKDYVIFHLSIDGDKLRAEHESLTEAEENSDFVAFQSIELDDCMSLDENLQELSEECQQAILDSEFFELV